MKYNSASHVHVQFYFVIDFTCGSKTHAKTIQYLHHKIPQHCRIIRKIYSQCTFPHGKLHALILQIVYFPQLNFKFSACQSLIDRIWFTCYIHVWQIHAFQDENNYLPINPADTVGTGINPWLNKLFSWCFLCLQLLEIIQKFTKNVVPVRCTSRLIFAKLLYHFNKIFQKKEF